MQVIEYRRFIRHPLCMPLSYTLVTKVKKAVTSFKSETINVSLGGLLFSSKKAVEVGHTIIIHMPFESKVFHVKAKVVRCEKSANKKFHDIAVCFMRIQEAFKVKMIEQIYLIAQYRDLLSTQTGKDISMEEASRKWIKRYSERFSKLYW